MRLTLKEEATLNQLDLEGKSKKISDSVFAVQKASGKTLILSGAGTGKTSLFRAKIKSWINSGIDPQKILVTSFINYIVDDLKKSLPSDCNVITLHKFAKIILHKYLGIGGTFRDGINDNFVVATGIDESILTRDLFWLLKEKVSEKKIKAELHTYLTKPDGSPLPSFWNKYLSLTTLYNLITFKDLIVRASKILRDKPNLYPIEKLIVDEFQDFNGAEHAIIDELLGVVDDVIIAGDDDQSIYSSTKNADPSGILKKCDDSGWNKLGLPLCLRTKSAAIVTSAIDIVRKQTNRRIDKSYLPMQDNGKKINVIELSKSESKYLIEAEYIASQIDKEALDKWDEPYPLYMIIGRNTRHLEVLAKRVAEILDIDIEAKKKNIYDDKELIKLISHLKLIIDPHDNLSHRRILHLSRSKAYAKKYFMEGRAVGAFNYAMSDFANSLKPNMNALIKIDATVMSTGEKLEKIIEVLKLDKNNENIKVFLEKNKDKDSIREIFYHESEEIIEEKEKERLEIQQQKIQFLTIWGSKGLKAENVFIVGLEEGYLPKDNKNVQDEELRLMYVAMTRAVESLTLIACKMRADGVHEHMGSIGHRVKNKSIFLSYLEPKNTKDQAFNKADLKRL